MRKPGGGSRTARGVTLVELLVTLAILGVTLAVAGLGVRSLRAPPVAAAMAEIARARQHAAVTGRSTAVTLGRRSVRFAPDGSASGGPIVTDSLVLCVEALTGAVRARPR